MPYQLSLTWMPHAKRWRKRYQGRTYYLRSKSNGRRDREGYLAALAEWERLKSYIDGIGDSPYTATGAIIPETPVERSLQVHSVSGNRFSQPENSNRVAERPSWIQSTGIGAFLHPEQIVNRITSSPHTGERRISALADYWLEKRHKQTTRNELSLQQYAEDKGKLQTFRDFLSANFPEIVHVDQLSPQS